MGATTMDPETSAEERILAADLKHVTLVAKEAAGLHRELWELGLALTSAVRIESSMCHYCSPDLRLALEAFEHAAHARKPS